LLIQFDALMATLGPFEKDPRVAVAVSGGADSMALALLAHDWGNAVALTVDHRLRPESSAEAEQVGSWMAARGIEHHILTWENPKADQAQARAARYRLMGDWCRRHHILHLLVAHHREDQAETLMLRLGRGSGVDGLAAMAAVSFKDDLQILRPLLSVGRDDLRTFLREKRQDWVEDPSNRMDRFERVRWRKIMAANDVSTERLALTAAQMGRARQALEAAQAALAVDAIALHQAGFAWLDPDKLRAAPQEIGLRTLAALIRCIGGEEFPPRLDGLTRAYEGLDQRRTFGGCVLTPRKQGILVHREVRALAPAIPLAAGQWTRWDNRFALRVEQEGLTVGALGDGWDSQEIPKSVLPSLPAIADKHGILAVPPLGWLRAGGQFPAADWGFRPVYPLAGAGFRLVKAPARIM
jgi:tRNA(Ile)-lysidine synthase